MVTAAAQQGRNRQVPPHAKVVVQFDRAERRDAAYRVEAPARIVRMWSVLYATDTELRRGNLSPQALPRLQRLLGTVRTELELSVSPPLARELRHLTAEADAPREAGELRVECASLLGWASGLVVGILDQLDAAGNTQSAANPSHGP